MVKRLLVFVFFVATMGPAICQTYYTKLYPDTLAYDAFGSGGADIEGTTTDIGGFTWVEYLNQSEIKYENGYGEVYAQGTANYTHNYSIDIGIYDEYEVTAFVRDYVFGQHYIGLLAKTTGTPSDSCFVLFNFDVVSYVYMSTITSGSGASALQTQSYTFSRNSDWWYRFSLQIFDTDSVVGRVYHYSDDNRSTAIDTLMFTLRGKKSLLPQTGVGIFSYASNSADVSIDDFTVLWTDTTQAQVSNQNNYAYHRNVARVGHARARHRWYR